MLFSEPLTNWIYNISDDNKWRWDRMLAKASGATLGFIQGNVGGAALGYGLGGGMYNISHPKARKRIRVYSRNRVTGSAKGPIYGSAPPKRGTRRRWYKHRIIRDPYILT